MEAHRERERERERDADLVGVVEQHDKGTNQSPRANVADAVDGADDDH